LITDIREVVDYWLKVWVAVLQLVKILNIIRMEMQP